MVGASRGGAVLSGDPKVGGAGVEDDGELLTGGTDFDVTVELGRVVVGEGDFGIFTIEFEVTPFSWDVIDALVDQRASSISGFLNRKSLKRNVGDRKSDDY